MAKLTRLQTQRLTDRIRANLGPHLLSRLYSKRTPANVCPSWGCCYVASEAAYHAFARAEGWTPAYIKLPETTHWFLIRGREILDLTADQFPSVPDYSKAIRCGFLTRQPSKRARILLQDIARVNSCII